MSGTRKVFWTDSEEGTRVTKQPLKNIQREKQKFYNTLHLDKDTFKLIKFFNQLKTEV